MVVESILPNQIKWSWYHSFQKTMFDLMKYKCLCYRFEYQSNENWAFRFFGTPGKWCKAHHFYFSINAVVTPVRKAASYEPRIAMLGIWGDTWLTRGKCGIYVVVTGALRGLRDAFYHVKSALSTVLSCLLRGGTRIPSLVLRNTWHFVIIRYSYGDLRGSYEAALRKGMTTA